MTSTCGFTRSNRNSNLRPSFLAHWSLLLSAARCITKDIRVVSSTCLGLTDHVVPLDYQLPRHNPLAAGKTSRQKPNAHAMQGSACRLLPRCLVPFTGWPIGTSRPPFLHSSNMQHPPRRLTIWCTMTDLREYPRSFFKPQSDKLKASHILFCSPHRVCDYFQRYQTVVTDSHNRR